MRTTLSVPLKKHGSDLWGDLCSFGHHTIEVVAEKFNRKNENYSFVGGHRVRLYKATKNVHFKVPQGVDIDISAVASGPAPPARRQRP